MNVYQDFRGTRTPGVSRESATRTRTVEPREPVKITSAWIRAVSRVEPEQTVMCRTTWQSVDVPGEPLETPSGTAGGSPGTRSVLPAERTLTARLERMTDRSVDADQPISGTLCPGVDTSVTRTVSVDKHKPATVNLTDVFLLVIMVSAEKMLIATPSTIGHNVRVLPTSLEIPTPDVTLSVPATTTAPVTRLVSA